MFKFLFLLAPTSTCLTTIMCTLNCFVQIKTETGIFKKMGRTSLDWIVSMYRDGMPLSTSRAVTVSHDGIVPTRPKQ